MTLGVTLSVGALGALLGALLAPRAAARFPLGRVILVSVVLSDVAPLAIPFLPPGQLGIVVAAGAFFVQGVGMTGCNVHIYALRQTVTPEQLMGRTNASYQFLTQGVIPLGALAGGLLGETVGLRGGLLVGCVGLLTTAVWFWLSPIRSLVSMPGVAAGPTGDAPLQPGGVPAPSG
jgi:MFS family permease